MKKAGLLFAAAPILIILLAMFALTAGGTSSSSTIIAPVVASEQKAEEYATVATKLGVRWEVVLLADSILARNASAADMEAYNPMITTMRFLILHETIENYVVVGQITDTVSGTKIDQYDWVVERVTDYAGKDRILAYFQRNDTVFQQGFTPEALTALAVSTGAAKSAGNTRCKLTFSANPNFAAVLKNDLYLTDQDVEWVLELTKTGGVGLLNLSEEARGRIRALQAQYGMSQFVEGEYVNCEGLKFTDGGREVTYFNQLDYRWAELPYGQSGSIGKEGCGPTAMAIVVSTLTAQTVDPLYMANWAAENGHRCEGQGSYRTLIPGAAEAFGLSVATCGIQEGQRVIDSLADGALVVAIMGPGTFTTSGHFIVLRGVTQDGKILIADPASTKRSAQTWDLSLILNEVSKTQAATGPIWIIK